MGKRDIKFNGYVADRVRLEPGDCREVLRSLPDCSVDSVVTDPPYAIASILKRFGKPDAAPAGHGTDGAYARASRRFLGQTWDTGETAFCSDFWTEALRVLKPGGHVVACSGRQTYHHLALGLELAGFEIRDLLAWLYGSGRPMRRTLLKAALEPIAFGRKPLIGTVETNRAQFGCGAIDVEACRVGDRWPANVLHDGSDEVLAAFPGRESRFFYAAKASAWDRASSEHPTVKPVSLMRWLVRLVTPPGGLVLDPFAGSGTTGTAAYLEGMRCVLVEREAAYQRDIEHRLAALCDMTRPAWA